MILHVLPGDAYVEAFRKTGLDGEVAIFREALIDGDLDGEGLSDLFQTREHYHAPPDGVETQPYDSRVAAEIKKLLLPGAGDEIDLWFEYELFCSVNYWFCLDLLRRSTASLYRVAPTVRTDQTRWSGFAGLDEKEMSACWSNRVTIDAKDLEHGSRLWSAFRTRDRDMLQALDTYDSPAYPFLEEVVSAAMVIDAKPRAILRDIISNCEHDFETVFSQFTQKAGVYGFGDVQVKRLLREFET